MYHCEYNQNEYPECDEEELKLLQKTDIICMGKGLRWRYFPGSGFLFIYSQLGVWKFKLHGQKFALYHQNKRWHTTGSYMGCFHKQQYLFNDLESLLIYIFKHDTRKYEKEARRMQNSSIEKAYRKIKKQKVMQNSNVRKEEKQ